eukprot:30029-Eustigmatos_ZCMA.PRE.1
MLLYHLPARAEVVVTLLVETVVGAVGGIHAADDPPADPVVLVLKHGKAARPLNTHEPVPGVVD